MPLSQDDQELIARAIADGKLRRIPMGQSGEVTYRRRRGRKVNTVALRMVKALADRSLPDAAIAEEIGKTKKAVQGIRYRHGIDAGCPRRRQREDVL